MAGVSGNDKNGTRDDDGIAWDTRSNAVKIEGKKKKKTNAAWNHREIIEPILIEFFIQSVRIYHV